MTFEIKYSLNQLPAPALDGSGMVLHQITAMSNKDGEGWVTIPGRSKTFCIPAAELAVVMAMPDGTAQEKQAKNTAYKQALVENVGTQVSPLVGWTKAILEELVEINDAANTVANAAVEYITVTLGQTLPVPFNL